MFKPGQIQFSLTHIGNRGTQYISHCSVLGKTLYYCIVTDVKYLISDTLMMTCCVLILTTGSCRKACCDKPTQKCLVSRQIFFPFAISIRLVSCEEVQDTIV